MKIIPRPEWLTPELEAQFRALHAKFGPSLGRYRIVQQLEVSHHKGKILLKWLHGHLQFEGEKPFQQEPEQAESAITITPGNPQGVPDPSPLHPEDTAEVKEVDGKKWIHNKAYVYDEKNDVYYTFLRSAKSTITVPGPIHREMKKAYSNWDGNPQTINQIAVLFQIPRAWLIEYKAKHGWTHDSDPFSDEEVIGGDVDGLVEDALLQKRLSLTQRFQAKAIEQDRKDALKFRELETLVVQPLLEKLSAGVPRYDVPKLQLQQAREPFALVVPPYDLHFGKGAWIDETGEHYSREEAAKLLQQKTTELLEMVSVYGKPERIIFPVGSDFFNSDTYFGTTTKGTPQDNDGSAAQILIEGCELLASTVDLLRAVTDEVHLLEVAGNHDRQNTLSSLLFLRAWYRNTNGVVFQHHHQPRAYSEYGQNLLGFTHGDGPKVKELPALMAGEAREAWGRTLHRVWFTGHLHEEKSGNPGGVLWYQLPSLSGADRFHSHKGYTLSRRAMQAFLIGSQTGPRAIFTAPVLQEVGA